jgi:hypothetical protein
MGNDTKNLQEPAATGVNALRLLRHCGTQEYFTPGGWTRDLAEAQVFESEMEAVRACILNSLYDVELVLRLQDSDSELFTTRIR